MKTWHNASQRLGPEIKYKLSTGSFNSSARTALQAAWTIALSKISAGEKKATDDGMNKEWQPKHNESSKNELHFYFFWPLLPMMTVVQKKRVIRHSTRGGWAISFSSLSKPSPGLRAKRARVEGKKCKAKQEHCDRAWGGVVSFTKCSTSARERREKTESLAIFSVVCFFFGQCSTSKPTWIGLTLTKARALTSKLTEINIKISNYS